MRLAACFYLEYILKNQLSILTVAECVNLINVIIIILNLKVKFEHKTFAYNIYNNSHLKSINYCTSYKMGEVCIIKILR